jgi:ribosomal protein S18 acetylase RimI-like enzyme
MVRYTLRAAEIADIDVLVGFTIREAQEAEGEALNPEAARRGVSAAFDNPALATYWVAESLEGAVVASTSVVKEWSNFHGGSYWWIQSLFIDSEHRGAGLVEAILHHLSEEAASAGALDLRLYVHKSNGRALRAYQRYGFSPSPYIIMFRPPAINDAP